MSRRPAAPVTRIARIEVGTGAYDWWMTALEMVGDYGVLTREQGYAIGIHEDTPQPGFYRVPPPKRSLREDDRTSDAFVAIWQDGTTMRALWDGEPTDPVAVWAWCCRSPIDEDRYRAVEAAGFGVRALGIFAGQPATRSA
jgi:hypothetical protein